MMRPIGFSEVDLSRSNGPARDFEMLREERTKAVRVVASAAGDAAECATLLDMLGLRADEGGQPRPKRQRPEQARGRVSSRWVTTH
jgi:hypothetical protein